MRLLAYRARTWLAEALPRLLDITVAGSAEGPDAPDVSRAGRRGAATAVRMETRTGERRTGRGIYSQLCLS